MEPLLFGLHQQLFQLVFVSIYALVQLTIPVAVLPINFIVKINRIFLCVIYAVILK